MPATLGTASKTIFINEVEGDKLTYEFLANAQIYAGQPVKMNANESVDPMAAGDSNDIHIGVAMFDAAVGTLVTVAMRGYTVIYAMSSAALNAGPVEVAAYDGTNFWNKFATSTAVGKTLGHSLDTAGAANVQIRVVLK